MTIQLLLGLVLVLAIWIYSLLSEHNLLQVNLTGSPHIVHLFAFYWLQYFGGRYFFIGRIGADAISLEFALFVGTLVINTAWFLTFAPDAQDDDRMQIIVPLRSQCRRPGIASRMLEFDHRGSADAQPFCLELACYLLEASYQAYFPVHPEKMTYHMLNDSYAARIAEMKPPPTSTTAEPNEAVMSGPKLDLSRLGLRSCGVFSCSAFSTFGFLGRTDSEFIVTFRGSTLANIISDFKFTQIPLPDLRRSVPFFVEAFSFIECRGNPFKISGADENIPRSLDESLEEVLPDLEEGIQAKLKALAAKCINMLPLCNQTLPRVHLGFWESYASIRDEFMTKIAQALFIDYFQAKTGNSGQQAGCDGGPLNVIFTGHSLGAAMTTLAALELAENMPTLIQAMRIYAGGEDVSDFNWLGATISIYCFGSPRVGNSVFAAKLQHEVNVCYRVQVDGDIVAMVPKFLGFYRHVGTTVLVDELASGNIVVQPSVMEQVFFKRSTGTIANHSLEKYRLCLEACFDPEDYAHYLAKEFWHLAAADGALYGASGNKTRIPLWANPC